MVGAAVGDDRALRDALRGRDRLRVGRGRAVRGAGVARRRVGRAEQRHEEDQDAFGPGRSHVCLPSCEEH